MEEFQSTYTFGVSELENQNIVRLIGHEIFPENIRHFSTIKSIKIWFGTSAEETKVRALLGIQLMYLNYFTGEKKMTEYQGVPLTEDDIEEKELKIIDDDYLSKIYIGFKEYITHLKFETKNGQFIEVGNYDKEFEKQSVRAINEGKNIKGNNTAIANHTATAQDMAFARERGRNVGLDVAAIESMKGANANSADAAAAGAIDAFQGEVTPEDLAKDEQELGLDELPQGLNEDLQDELKRSIGDDINKQASKSSNTAKGKEYSINDNCMDTNGNFVRECFWSKFWMNLGNKAIDTAFGCVASGCWNKWGSSGFTASGEYAFNNGQIFYKGLCIGGC